MKKQRADAMATADGILAAVEKQGREMTREESSIIDTRMTEVNRLNAQIKMHDANNTLASLYNQNPGAIFDAGRENPAADLPRKQLNKGFISNLVRQATSEQREEWSIFLDTLAGRISASADLTPGGGGGAYIPSFVALPVEMNIASFTPVRNICRILPTATGAPTVVPVLSDSESAEQLTSNEATGLDDVVSGDTPPTALTGPVLGSYKISSKPILVPRETITDGVGDIVGDVLGALIARVSRFENLRYTTGTGSGQAQGFLTGCSLFETSGNLDLDMALDLTYGVPPLYRPNGVYMANDATIKFLRKIKTGLSGDKRTIWTDYNQRENTPATLHGYPIYVNNDMPAVASDGSFIDGELAFGDFSRYIVRMAEQGTPYVYRWPVPAKDGMGLIVLRRSDARLLVPTAIAKLSLGGS